MRNQATVGFQAKTIALFGSSEMSYRAYMDKLYEVDGRAAPNKLLPGHIVGYMGYPSLAFFRWNDITRKLWEN